MPHQKSSPPNDSSHDAAGDRNRITAAGATTGLDFGPTVVAELRDRIYAECCQLMSEYDPELPFNTAETRLLPRT